MRRLGREHVRLLVVGLVTACGLIAVVALSLLLLSDVLTLRRSADLCEDAALVNEGEGWFFVKRVATNEFLVPLGSDINARISWIAAPRADLAVGELQGAEVPGSVYYFSITSRPQFELHLFRNWVEASDFPKKHGVAPETLERKTLGQWL